MQHPNSQILVMKTTLTSHQSLLRVEKIVNVADLLLAVNGQRPVSQEKGSDKIITCSLQGLLGIEMKYDKTGSVLWRNWKMV